MLAASPACEEVPSGIAGAAAVVAIDDGSRTRNGIQLLFLFDQVAWPIFALVGMHLKKTAEAVVFEERSLERVAGYNATDWVFSARGSGPGIE